MTVVGCYRPPSAVKEALTSLSALLLELDYKAIILIRDFNWDCLSSAADNVKDYCDSINLTQILKVSTRPNQKNMEKIYFNLFDFN